METYLVGNTFGDQSNRMICISCGEGSVSDCRYLEAGNDLLGTEFGCSFPWEDTLYDSPVCEKCPLAMCRECRDLLVVNASAFLKSEVNSSDNKVICPYCGERAKCINSKDFYSDKSDYGMMYVCYDCDARISCHPNTRKPKGTMADKDLRELRKKVHREFDNRCRILDIKKNAGYAWLEKETGIRHIAETTIEDCNMVIMRFKKEKKNV